MSISTARLGLQGLRGLPSQARRSRVGIEAGETWLRFAQQSHHEGGHRWSVAEAHLSPGRMDGSKETGRHLSTLVKQAGISRGSAICAISSPAIDIFPLNLRTTESGELAGLVVSQVREQLSYSLEEAVLDYAVLPDQVRRAGDDTTAVLAFAAPRALTESLLRTLERAGIVVDQLLTPACVLAPTVAQSDPLSRHLLIATGEDATSVSVVEGSYVLLERILSWSLNRLIQHLQADLDLEEGQCRSLLARAPLAETPDVQAEAVSTAERSLESTLQEVLGPSFQELTREASGCVGYCDSVLQPRAVSSLVLAGPLAGHVPLQEFLGTGLGLPVVVLGKSIELPGWEGQSDAAVFATAASCAIWSGGEPR